LLRRRRRAFLESRSTAGLRLEHLLRAAIRIAGRSQDRAQRRKLLALNQHPNLFGVDRLALQQCGSNAVHRILVRFEDGVRCLVGLIDQPANFEIDLPCRLLAEVAMLRNLAAQEDLLFLLAEGKRTEAAHAVLADHAAGEGGGKLGMAACAGGHLVEEDLLSHASAVGHSKARFEILARVVVPVAGQEYGDAQSHSTRNDGDLVDGVRVLAEERNQRMAGFVIRSHPLFLIRKQHGLALGSHEHLVIGQLKVVHRDLLAIHAGSIQRSLVHHVGKVGSTEARCSTGQYVEVGVIGDGNLFDVYAKNLLAATHIGQAHHHAAVEAAGAQQRGIENVGPVGGRDQDHAVVRFKSVHLDEQLIQCLFALIVSAAQAGAAMAADSVDFIDEDDRKSVLLALFKQVAYTASADADKHLNKV